ncbi:PD-(D/E)XK motif protein [Geodermatophilus obscurus]|uniref:PD-(D/E)XK family member n=1 Tax=Geodermatophilus obscurus (strain ATCC 25078 / DSM 43160 / JCM 3152 / CCUG 61914 / KCC A-0152 / KCTC 9177 / NBRC 13315 / NRRL B-3577 / G-20) TaxID=526225 RepID=D2S8A0_GEOOG|nr:PD-(D/E)XK motif protein [Geodermatophilus obscurus]ADB73522.1 conserved hypothetical protein [Geodermatophilus obscurus DSM 43160]
MTVAGVWAELENEPGDRGLALRRLHPEGHHDLHVAFNLESRRRQFMFGRPWRPVDVLPQFPVTQAIACRNRLATGGRRMDIVIELVDPALSDVFTPLVEDLAGRIVATRDANAATAELASGLARWQDLFEQLGRDGLSALTRRGLAGELLVLRTDVLPHVAPGAAIDAWTGPCKANQDFQRPAVAIEVKVTTGQNPQGFIVANERELDTTGAGTLVVAHLSLDERLGGTGGSINDLVDDLRQRLAGHPVALAAFNAKLARVGYLDIHRDRYSEPHYEVRTLRHLHVRDDFPRITEKELREGVGAVRYTVSLAACEGYGMDASAVHELIAQEDA